MGEWLWVWECKRRMTNKTRNDKHIVKIFFYSNIIHAFRYFDGDGYGDGGYCIDGNGYGYRYFGVDNSKNGDGIGCGFEYTDTNQHAEIGNCYGCRSRNEHFNDYYDSSFIG